MILPVDSDPGDRRHEYHGWLDTIRGEVIRLGAMTTETISRGTAALLDRDLHAAQEIIDADDELDTLSLRIEEQCFRILALQSPMASELRFIVCSIRMVSELERSADLVVNICKAARRLFDVEFDPKLRGLIEDMGLESAMLTRKAIDAYIDADDALAAALDDIDDRLDDLQVDFVETIFVSHQEGGLGMRAAVQLALIGRYYERIGDHAVNMGERIAFMVNGWLPEHTSAARFEQRARKAEEADPD